MGRHDEDPGTERDYETPSQDDESDGDETDELGRDDRVSLHPLDPEDVLRAFLKTPPKR